MTPRLCPEPGYIAIDVTYRCPARCPFCFLKNNALLNKRCDELSFPEVRRLIDAVGRPGKKFYITGGEPLVRRDILPILAWIKIRGHRFTLTTNGLLLNDTSIRFLAACPGDEVVVSLHGDKAVHEKCLGMKGVFGKVTRHIRKLTTVAGRRCRVNIWCTVNKYNYARLYEFFRLFVSLGPDAVHFNHLEFIDKESLALSARIWRQAFKKTLRIKPSADFAEGIDTKVLTAQIAKIKKLKDSRVRFDPDLPARALDKWYDPTTVLRRRSGTCTGQWNALWVSPSGDVLSCQPIAEPFGNLRTQPLRRIYTNKKYGLFRRALTKCGGFFPLCGRCGRLPFQTR